MLDAREREAGKDLQLTNWQKKKNKSTLIWLADSDDDDEPDIDSPKRRFGIYLDAKRGEFSPFEAYSGGDPGPAGNNSLSLPIYLHTCFGYCIVQYYKTLASLSYRNSEYCRAWSFGVGIFHEFFLIIFVGARLLQGTHRREEPRPLSTGRLADGGTCREESRKTFQQVYQSEEFRQNLVIVGAAFGCMGGDGAKITFTRPHSIVDCFRMIMLKWLKTTYIQWLCEMSSVGITTVV